jgi:hypothetical protein
MSTSVFARESNIEESTGLRHPVSNREENNKKGTSSLNNCRGKRADIRSTKKVNTKMDSQELMELIDFFKREL